MTLLNVKEVAAIFNVTERTVYGWVQDNSVPYFKLGGAIRFDKNEVLEATRKRKHGGESKCHSQHTSQSKD